MQNQYNNYLKRQKQNPMNNFKEKVANSLSGKTLNNTTMPNTANKIRPGVRTASQGSTSVSKSVQPVSNTNTNPIIKTPVNTQQTAQNTITPNQIQTPIETPIVANQLESTDVNNAEIVGGTGLMSLSDINNSISAPVNEITPAMARTASTNTTTNYKDLLEQNKNQQLDQAHKNWETQEQGFNQQIEALKGQYEQSKVDAENAYKDSVDKLNQSRYDQLEDLNVSGTNRGIQYSPQQLGLENVANINHNKNLVETSKQRNELLNKLQIEMNNSLAQLNMTMVNAKNEYYKNLLDINTNYNNTLMGWNREDEVTQSNRDWEQQMTDEKRKWEELQAQKDREWEEKMNAEKQKWEAEQTKQQQEYEKLMQELQNSWQSGENKLDREHEASLYKSSGRSSGYSRGYSSYGGYGGYSSYTPYSRSYYNGWDSYDDGVNFGDDIDERAYIATANEYSDDDFDAYNSLMSPYNADARATAYRGTIDAMIDTAKKGNASEDTIRSLNNTKDRAVKQMFENHSGYKNYGGDAVKRGDDKVKFYKKHVTNSLDRMKATQAERVMNGMRKNKTEDKKKTTTKSTKSTKTNKTVEKVKKSMSNSAKNTKKATTNSNNNNKKSFTNAKKNVKTSTTNAKKNVKTSTTNAKKNTKKSKNNALNNLKKNIGKLFGKK